MGEHLDKVREFWTACQAQLTPRSPGGRFKATGTWSFGDDPQMADELEELVVRLCVR